MTKKFNVQKKTSSSLEPQITDKQSENRYRDTEKLYILQPWLTDSSWIQLVHLIKWIWYKTEENANVQQRWVLIEFPRFGWQLCFPFYVGFVE